MPVVHRLSGGAVSGTVDVVEANRYCLPTYRWVSASEQAPDIDLERFAKTAEKLAPGWTVDVGPALCWTVGPTLIGGLIHYETRCIYISTCSGSDLAWLYLLHELCHAIDHTRLTAEERAAIDAWADRVEPRIGCAYEDAPKERRARIMERWAFAWTTGQLLPWPLMDSQGRMSDEAYSTCLRHLGKIGRKDELQRG